MFLESNCLFGSAVWSAEVKRKDSLANNFFIEATNLCHVQFSCTSALWPCNKVLFMTRSNTFSNSSIAIRSLSAGE